MQKKIIEKPEAAIYRFIKRENIKNNDLLAVIAKVEKSSLNMQDAQNMFSHAICNEAGIYIYSQKNQFIINYNIAGSDTLLPKAYSCSTYLKNNNKNGDLMNISIKKQNMEVESFMIAEKHLLIKKRD